MRRETTRFLVGADQSDFKPSAVVVADALASLPSAHREAIVESYLAGRTTRQAAAVLALPHDTVKSRVYYGLRELRGILQEQGWLR
ncbi:sigma factor-like helix-turn-helix DNA-binding protein [Streptomyces sp. NPDC001450]